MKKLITTLLLTLTICCCFSFLTACNHSHVFDKQVVSSEYKATDPTCEHKASYYFSCECGKKGSETFEAGLLLNHVYENKFCTSCGEKEYSEGLEFRLINDDTEYEFIGLGTCTDVEVVIPSTYNGKPVTSLAEYSFYYDYKTLSVKIPNSVKNIGEHSFRYCTNLKKVWLSDNLESVGLYVFEDCPKLNYTEVDGLHYLGNGNNPYIYLMASTLSYAATSVTIMDGCKFISKYVFYEYTELEEVNLPETLIFIGNYAFYSCKGLTSITFPTSLLTLGNGCFSDCKKLTSLTLPASLTTIGSAAFAGCKNLTTVTFKETSQLKTMGSAAFSQCVALKRINFGNTYIRWNAITFPVYGWLPHNPVNEIVLHCTNMTKTIKQPLN